MSVSLLEVIEYGGYDITTKEDAIWLLSKQLEFEELIEKAENIIETAEELELKEVQRESEEEEL